MKRYINKLHYSKNLSIFNTLIKLILPIFSLFYLIGYLLKSFLFKIKLLKVHSLPAYVISIGNLTTGGTGKTPITHEIANYLSKKCGKNVSILSHGYGGSLSTNDVNIISDGINLFFSAHLAGDEPYMLASNLSDVPVITGRKRYKSGEYAINNYHSNVLILDDGYQHIQLKRDLNLLVIDCKNQFGNKFLLPAGPLREPISEIKRADKIILVNKNPYDEEYKQSSQKLMEELKKKYNKPVIECNFKAKGILNIINNKNIETNGRVYAFAGIAQPYSFFKTLKELGFDVVKKRDYTDHHLYTTYDFMNITKEAKKAGADYIITTEKDIVKLSALVDSYNDIPLCYMKLGIELDMDAIVGDIQ